MRRFLPIFLVALVVASCQGVGGGTGSSSAIPVAEASDATEKTAVQTASSSPSKSGQPASALPAKPPASETPASSEPVEPFRSVTVTADALAASLIIPLPVSRDASAQAVEAERDRVDRLIAEGGLTREAGAKRLYRLASKNGFVRTKADELLWQSIIQAYRNLDDRFISIEDAASDIAAAFQQRRSAK